jgi:hypothetical protein
MKTCAVGVRWKFLRACSVRVAYLDMSGPLQEPLVQYPRSLSFTLTSLEVDEGLQRRMTVSPRSDVTGFEHRTHLPDQFGHVESLLYGQLKDTSSAIDVAEFLFELGPSDPGLSE